MNMFDYVKLIWKTGYCLKDEKENNPLYKNLSLEKTTVSSCGDMYFGTIKNAGAIGPVFCSVPDGETVSAAVRSLNIRVAEYKSYENYLFSVPVMSLSELSKIVCMVNFAVNNEEIKPNELFPSSQGGNSARSALPPVRNYQIEQAILPLIRNGDAGMINILLSGVNFKTVFRIGKTSLSSMKKIAVSFITLSSREAIKGGADVEDALSKSDDLLLELDDINSVEGVLSLLYRVALSFARLAGRGKTDARLSLVTVRAVKYITRNVNNKITLSGIAAYAGVSPNYLSSLFKKETGMTPLEYAEGQKLGEAKRLLKESTMSLADIANSLAYSSQSYFQNRFKSAFGVTPGQYRKGIDKTK